MSVEEPNRPERPPWAHVAVVLLVCLAVYWPRLGATGFSDTEGHRVIPGWTMLEQGDWLLPRMFGQVYLRKPPGMPWAVAGSAWLLGESEFSARAVSASASTASALLALVFGARWFGRRYGIAAGLAWALTPLFWRPGRSAEIEALNNFTAMAAVLLVIDVALGPPKRSRLAALGRPVLAAGAMVLAALAKGPASFAAIGAAVALGGIGLWPVRSVRPRRVGVWAAVLLAAAGMVILQAMISRARNALESPPIVQGVTEFLWSREKLTPAGIGRVLVMPLVALATALPASAALLFPWGPDARAEGSEAGARSLPLARALAGVCLLSLLALAAFGIDNPRYAMPSLVCVPVLAAYVARGWGGAFVPLRRRIAAGFMLGHRLAWPVLLIAGAALYVVVIEPRLRRTSGREAGETLASALPDGAQVWADHMIEARPEVLLYAQRRAAAEGRAVSVLWVPRMADFQSLPRAGYLLLRTDKESGEAAAYRSQGFMDRLVPVASGRVHKFEFTLYRKDPSPAVKPS